jgi:hypothetical protein
MVLSHGEILGRLYSMKKTITDFKSEHFESAKVIQDLIDDIEE